MSERMPMYPAGGYPQIVKALLPIGDLVLQINRDTKEIIDQGYNFRDSVSKKAKNGHIPISTQFFLNPYYSFISGVLYSYANAFNPIELDKLGCDFFFVHNPLAKNKIVEGAIKCGQEYVVQVDAESFTMKPVVNHEKSYRDRTAPHRTALPHHRTYGSVYGGSADQAESDPGEYKSE